MYVMYIADAPAPRVDGSRPLAVSILQLWINADQKWNPGHHISLGQSGFSSLFSCPRVNVN